jgi:HEAT repeat protein
LTNKIFGLVFQNNSGWLRVAQVLFQLEDVSPKLQLIPGESLQRRELEFAKRQILDELGLEVSIPLLDDNDDIAVRELELAIKDGKTFPSTKRMAELAQSLVDVDFRDNDLALLAYLEQEELIFRAIEKIIVNEKLEKGFSSVDDFISYSLSVQNRRKSRMGYALQNHLARIFSENKLSFDAQVLTEGKSKPDFIFPGKNEYHSKTFKPDLLVMLAVKSSLKERWRQILTEAKKIPAKHLCTLQQAISVDQTSEMTEEKVTLVIPGPLHNTYTNIQKKKLWTLDQFVDHVKFKQSRN